MVAPPGVNRARELLVVSVVALVLTIVFTWPLAARFGTAGRLENGDARFSIWNVSWVAHSLTSDPRNIWNANIFYPHTGTLAYSEANLVAGTIGIPVWVLTHNPYATSNFTIFMAFVLALVAMYALVLDLTGSRWAAFVVGVGYAFCSYSFAHLAHIQLLMTFGPPLALLRMHKFVGAPSVRNALWLGLALFVQALACGYYGLYGGLVVALGILWFAAVSGQWRLPRFWMLTALAAVIAVGLTAPFLAPYIDLQHAGFARSLDDARLNSATIRDYLTSALLLYRWMLPTLQAWGGWHDVLFPGGPALIFAGVIVVWAARPSPTLAMSRQLIGFYGVLAILAVWGSLGPDARLYTWLVDTVPFMTLLRAPARLGVFVALAVGVLGGVGLATFERRWTGRTRTVWLSLIVIFSLASASVGPLQLETAAPLPRAVMALQRIEGGAVAEFPFFNRGRDLHQHTLYMLASTFHWHPLINGYSDFLPPDVGAALPDLVRFPSSESIAFLRARGTKYVVVHWQLYSPSESGALRIRIRDLHDALRPMVEDADASLFELVPAGVR